MAKISKTHSLSTHYKPSVKLMMFSLILLTVCAISRLAEAETSIYVFGPDQSTVVKTGGFAGVHETYAVTGQFRLNVDSDSSVASFEIVDANLTDETGSIYGQSLNEIFNMTALAGTVIDDTTIEFEGKTADGTESDVRLKLSLSNDMAHLTGKTTPPPDSADMFFYDIDAVAAKKYAGGTGESDNPYLIFTPEQMNTIGTEPNDWDKHFKLMEDIDLVGYIGTDLNIIGYWLDWSSPYNKPFAGVFEGNGHTISNFTSQGTNRMGLFGYVDGKNAHIKDLGLSDPNIDARRYVGSLVGHMRMGVITNCYVEGGSVGGNSNVGGLVGFQDYGTITNCYTTVSVSGDTYTGGLVGNNNWWCRISDCYSTASVSGKEYVGGLVGLNRGTIANCYVQSGSVLGSNTVGGFVGSNGWPQLPMARPYPPGEITNCYSTTKVSGNNHVGGLVGRQGYGRITASFWDKETSGQTTSDGGVGKTTAEMQTESTFLETGWDFMDESDNGTEDIWKISEDLDYPRLWWEKYSGGNGTSDDPYLIATAEDLMLLGETPEDYDKHFILTSDIDLDPNLPGRKVFDRAVIAPDVNDTDFYYEFQGIPFSGVFNGNGHTISHLTIEGISNLGLFGQLQEQGEVSNVGLAAVNVNGIYGIGAIVGDNFGGSIADSSSNGSVNGNWFVGGLVGNNSVGSIINCCSTGMVTGKGDIGGLVGHNGYPERSNAVLANCYSAAIANGGYRVGGLAGSNDKGNITTCFSAGAVTGIGDVGGLVGNNSVGSITNSYSTGNVSGDEVVGGLVGYNADSNITMSYSSGDVSGGDWTAGGLMGWNYNGSIAMSYSTGTVTGKWIVGGLVGYNAESSINTSYSSSEVIGHGYIGGLIGCNEDSNITLSYSSGVVTGNEDVGGLVGYNWLSSSDVGSTTFSFWDMESSGQATSAGGEGKTTSEMQTASTFLQAGWDFVDETVNGAEDIWWILEGQDYPRLWWEAAEQ